MPSCRCYSMFTHSKKNSCYFCDCEICWLLEALLGRFSLSKSRILSNLEILLFCDICCSVFLGRKKKSLLLLRFLRNLRTSQSPSWPFLFLSLEFCQIWISWYSCDIVFTGSNKKSFLPLLRFLRNLLHFWYQFPLFFIFFFDKIAQTIC